MTTVKIKSHQQEWGKKIIGFVFRGWRDKTVRFHQAWAKIDERYRKQILKESYLEFKAEVKEELLRNKLKHNLSRIYHKTFCDNTLMAFRTWHFVSLKKHNQLWTKEERELRVKFEGLENRYHKAVGKHNSLVDFDF